MKRMKKIISALCVMSMVMTLGMMVVPVNADEIMNVVPQKTLLDVTLAKPVYSSSMLDEGTTNHTYAVDYSADDQNSNRATNHASYAPASYWAPAADDTAPWIMVDLTQQYAFKRLDFQIEPKKNFIISASKDGEDWVVLHTQGDTEYTKTQGWFLRLELEKADYFRYIKISRPEGYNGDGFKVYDISVYAPYHSNQINVAQGLGRAKITGGIENDNDPEGLYKSYYEKNLADGYIKDNWALSYGHVSSDDTTKDYFTIDLGKAYKINYIELSNCNSKNSDNTVAVTTSKPDETNAGAINNFEIWGANIGGDAETLQAHKSAELGGSYKGRNAKGEEIDFGPQWSTVRFDMDFSEPKRYIQIAADNNIQKLSLAEIGIYTDSEDVVTTAVLEDVVVGKPSYGATGDTRAANGYAHDRGDYNTSWKSFTDPNGDGDTSDAHMVYSVDLGGIYNIRKIEVKVTEDSCCGNVARKNFEIWGGSVKRGISYDEDNDAQMLACQGSIEDSDNTMTFDVEVFNRTQFITIAAKENHQIFREIYVWAEADGQYKDVSTGKTASLSVMTDGKYRNMPQASYCDGITLSDGTALAPNNTSKQYPEGNAYTPKNNKSLGHKGNNYEMPTHWIDLGKPIRVDFLRLYSRQDSIDYFRSHRSQGYTVWGSNDLTSDWVQLTTVQTNPSLPFRYSEVPIVSTGEYRYIAIARNNNDLSRGIWFTQGTGGTVKYNVVYNVHDLEFPEVTVYSKVAPEAVKNVAALATVINPTEDNDVAKIFDGDVATSYTGETALIDLGTVYKIDSFEVIGGGDNLAISGYTDESSTAALENGGSYRYISIENAEELSELRLLTAGANVSKNAVTSCKFQDSAESGGNEIVTLKDYENLGADLHVCNITNMPVTVNCFVALYDTDGILKSLNVVSDTLVKYESKNLVTGFSAPGVIEKGYELKAFVWTDGMKSLDRNYSLVQE